jgi:hypothetical protein
VFPFRIARKSATGRASSREGGSGAPGLPHAESIASASSGMQQLSFAKFMRKEREYHLCKE